MNGVYWGATAMHLMGRLGDMDRDKIILFLKECQVYTLGRFLRYFMDLKTKQFENILLNCGLTLTLEVFYWFGYYNQAKFENQGSRRFIEESFRQFTYIPMLCFRRRFR